MRKNLLKQTRVKKKFMDPELFLEMATQEELEKIKEKSVNKILLDQIGIPPEIQKVEANEIQNPAVSIDTIHNEISEIQRDIRDVRMKHHIGKLTTHEAKRQLFRLHKKLESKLNNFPELKKELYLYKREMARF